MPLNKKIFIIDDDPIIRETLKEYLEGEDFLITTFRSITRALKIIDIDENLPNVILVDINILKINELISSIKKINTNIHIILMTEGYEKMEDVLAALKNGAYDHLKKPINNEELFLRISRAFKEASLEKEVTDLKTKQEKVKESKMPTIVGVSREIKSLIQMVEKVAKSNASTVLLQGESGTGKELIAKTIHTYSRRVNNSFIDVNCAAIPETLLETELMGYEKGAYTDARKDKKGLLELADGGTLFLDEIGEMYYGMQAKLLRIIEERTFKRVGGVKEIKVDIRIIAATNAKLKKSVEEGTFREDLYYRLLVIPLHLPPLRDRKSDVLPLVEHFINRYNREFNKNIKGVCEDSKKILQDYSWPGNVRELRNVIERALILGDSDKIFKDQLPLEMTIGEDDKLNEDIDSRFSLPNGGISLLEVEKSLVRQALRAANGKQIEAAKLLGMDRHTFRRRMKKYNF